MYLLEVVFSNGKVYRSYRNTVPACVMDAEAVIDCFEDHVIALSISQVDEKGDVIL